MYGHVVWLEWILVCMVVVLKWSGWRKGEER